MKHQVYWKNDNKIDFPHLVGDKTCKVLIVGGGIGGTTLAYFWPQQKMQTVTKVKIF